MEKILLKQLDQLPRNTGLRIQGNFGSLYSTLETGNLVSLDIPNKRLTIFNTVYKRNTVLNTDNILSIEYSLHGCSYPLMLGHQAIFNTSAPENNGGNIQTGEFNAFLPITTLIGNAGMGPVLPLNYYYSPDVAFTKGGWAPRFSYFILYDSGVLKLHLHTGEAITVAQPLVPYSPMPGLYISSFNTVRDRHGIWAQAKIIHKDGTVECMTQAFEPAPGQEASSVDSALYVLPTQISNSLGHSLYLKWRIDPGTLLQEGFPESSGQNVTLSEVSDDRQVLLRTAVLKKKTTLAGKEVELDTLDFTQYPDKEPVKRCNLYHKDNRLVRHEWFNAGATESQEFTYTNKQLTAIESSRGLKETISYTADSRIARYSLSGSNASSDLVEDYTFTSSFARQTRTFDGTTVLNELHYDINDVLSKQISSQSDCVTTRQFKRNFDSKAQQFSLETQITYSKGSAQRTETELQVYEAAGNLIKQVQGDVTTEYTYYKGQSVDSTIVTNTSTFTDTSGFHGKLGYWIDHFGAIGWAMQAFGKQGMTWGTVEDRTVIREPVPTDGGKLLYNLPVNISHPGDPNYFRINVESEKCYRTVDGKRVELSWTYYGYTEIPVKSTTVRGSAVKPSLKLVIHQPQSDDGIRLKNWRNSCLVVQQTEYYTQTDTDSFGRIKSLSQRLLDSTGQDIALSIQKTRYAYTLEGDKLTTTTTFESAEKTQDTSEVTHSMRTQQLLFSKDQKGNSVAYSYDVYGQMLSKEDKEQEATSAKQTRYEYSLSKGCPAVTTTFPGGEQYREIRDAHNRIASTEARRSSAVGVAWKQLSSTTYDGLGREKLTTEYDYQPATDAATAIVKRQLEQFYDNWGQPCKSLVVGGMAQYREYDPVTRSMVEKQQYQAASYLSQTTHYNALGRIEKQTWRDASGSEYQSLQYQYDNAGRVTRQTPLKGSVKQFAWDSFDRLVKLSSEGIERIVEYPAHIASAQASRLAISKPADTFNYEWGSRTFDGLERVTAEQVAGRKKTYSYSGSNDWGLLASAVPQAVNLAGQVSTQRGYDAATTGVNLTTTDRGGTTTTATSVFSMRGLLLEQRDDFGNKTLYSYDLLGRLVKTSAPGVSTRLSYDSNERLTEETVTDEVSKTSMTITYKYDTQDRETERTFSASGLSTLVVRQAFDADGRLANVKVLRDGTETSQESFTYTPIGQLAVYQCSGTQRPVDVHGKKLSKQTFTYTTLGNISSCVSVFDGGQDTATYTCDTADQTQLRSISHSAAGIATAKLDYDALGRLKKNESGYTLDYNGSGLLSQMYRTDGGFREYNYLYDQEGKLRSCYGNDCEDSFYYRDDQQYARKGWVMIKNVYHNRFSLLANQSPACVLMQQTLKPQGGSDTTTRSFELKNAAGSVIASYDLSATPKALTLFSYTPFGYRPDDKTQRHWLGFNGQPLDRPTGHYLLGNGARVYNTALQAFQTPDNLSPFGDGGPNGYVYCSNDPVNFSDPSGHYEELTHYSAVTHEALAQNRVVQAGMNMAIGVGLTLATGGVGSGLAIAALGLEITSGAFGIAAALLAERDPQAASAFSGLSFVTAIAGAITGLSAVSKVSRYAGASGMGAAMNSERRVISAVKSGTENTTKYVTMGGTMKQLTMVQDDLYTFVDTYKGGSRLNLSIHGKSLSFVEEVILNEPSLVVIKGKGYSAAEVLTLLNGKGVDPKLYDSTRLIICYSGNGGANSFAAQFRNLTNKPVKAFVGPVTASHDGALLADKIAKLSNLSPSALGGLSAEAALSNYAAQNFTINVVKKASDFPLKLENLKKIALHSYNPVYF
ncbi:RHS repeat-associated core domain-containing protein [Pseudomonas sp. LJDD11]|uniref:RHS repeat domain-containing protein n=1 Tax=Pseudomonas sp. LJDD11 TaxID=2931984 RepID=UPI00211CA84B|nr:RHS repeat-associated core domain-containing protein [Pseudomonas sp. LJDD11]MCQ9427021.1 RHS repeat-associated core domain-containing protein [Pseudomonas sp. LJDD11]